MHERNLSIQKNIPNSSNNNTEFYKLKKTHKQYEWTVV